MIHLTTDVDVACEVADCGCTVVSRRASSGPDECKVCSSCPKVSAVKCLKEPVESAYVENGKLTDDVSSETTSLAEYTNRVVSNVRLAPKWCGAWLGSSMTN